MGQGIEAARVDAPEHAALIDDMKDQLLIVLMKRLGGRLSIPVAEVDNTSNDLLEFNVDFERKVFNFTVRQKS